MAPARIARTLSSLSPSVIYTAADQTIDFGAPQTTVDVAILPAERICQARLRREGDAVSIPNLAIAHILQSQAQKEVTANAALDALDQAIAGLLQVDVSAGSTITVDGTAARKCKMLRLTGTLAADAEVVVPDNRKPYFLQRHRRRLRCDGEDGRRRRVTVGASPNNRPSCTATAPTSWRSALVVRRAPTSLKTPRCSSRAPTATAP
jgi:hypothetical protein